MITKIRKLVWCGLAAAAALVAADASYVGKWKMNVAKSDFGDTTITFAQAPSGETQMTVDGQTYTFKTDGKDYDGMFGSKMSWKAAADGAWEATNKMGAKVLSTDTYKVSADGKSLSPCQTGMSVCPRYRCVSFIGIIFNVRAFLSFSATGSSTPLGRNGFRNSGSYHARYATSS